MKLWLLAATVASLALCSQAAYACTEPYTLPFDDVPSGGGLEYYDQQYGIRFYNNWEIVDHTASGWGPPHSGANVLMWDGNPLWAAGFHFGSDPNDYPNTRFLPYNVLSVSAYFSTEPGIVITMVGYNRGGTQVASAIIGAPAESWHNRHVEIFSQAGEINHVQFYGPNYSVDELRHFCLDDMTIVPVPEPCSLLALAGGVAGLGGMALRRRRG